MDQLRMEGRMIRGHRVWLLVRGLALLALVGGTELAIGGKAAARERGDQEGQPSRYAYNTTGLDSLGLAAPDRDPLAELPPIDVLPPEDLGLSLESPFPDRGRDDGGSETRLAAVLQAELSRALASSRSFRVSPLTGGRAGVDSTLGWRRAEPLEDVGQWDFVFGSSIGANIVEKRGPVFSGDSVAGALETVFGDRLSWNNRRRLDAMRNVRVARSEVLVTVVVNGYVKRGRMLLAEGRGAGVGKFRQHRDDYDSGWDEVLLESCVVSVVRGAVQDLLDSLQAVAETR
jgi:hypothetical protein